MICVLFLLNIFILILNIVYHFGQSYASVIIYMIIYVEKVPVELAANLGGKTAITVCVLVVIV